MVTIQKRKGTGHRNQEGAKGGESATIQRAWEEEEEEDQKEEKEEEGDEGEE